MISICSAELLNLPNKSDSCKLAISALDIRPSHKNWRCKILFDNSGDNPNSIKFSKEIRIYLQGQSFSFFPSTVQQNRKQIRAKRAALLLKVTFIARTHLFFSFAFFFAFYFSRFSFRRDVVSRHSACFPCSWISWIFVFVPIRSILPQNWLFYFFVSKKQQEENRQNIIIIIKIMMKNSWRIEFYYFQWVNPK